MVSTSISWIVRLGSNPDIPKKIINKLFILVYKNNTLL